MSFLSLEDESALYETVIFPKVYEKYNRLLFDQQPLLVYGRVCDDMGAVSFEVPKIETLVAKSPCGGIGFCRKNRYSPVFPQNELKS
jgi:DNA polymerase III alpha subunit